MRKSLIALLAAATLTMATAPAFAQQCVPYARAASGVSLRGDAWTWWAGADGTYDKGTAPREGAVMVFKKTGSMRHGHVAVVTKIVNKRTVLVDHANWAPRRGASRGKVTEDAAVMDVSPRNDWSQLRVWYGPVKDFGTKVYPAYGFIYPKKGGKGGVMQASYSPADDAFAAANGNYDPFNDSDEATSAAVAPKVQPVTSAPLAQLTVKPEAPKTEAAPQQQAMVEPVKVEAPKAAETPKIVEAAKIEAAPVAPKAEALPVTPVVAAKAEAKTEEVAKPSKAAKPPHVKTQKHVKMDVAVHAENAPVSVEPAKVEAAAEQWDGDALAAKLAGSGSYGGRSGS